MKRVALVIYGLCCVCFPTSWAADNMYKCKNKAGTIVFQQKPCASTGYGGGKVDLEALNKRYPSVSSQPSLPNKYNLIKNGDFESGLSHWDKSDSSKTESDNQAWVEHGLLKIQTIIPEKSKFVQQIKLEQCVPIGNAAEMTLAAKYKEYSEPVNLSANRINVYWMNQDDCLKGGEFGHYLEPKRVGGWQNLMRTRLVPALHAKAARVEIVQSPLGAKNKVAQWDNITLVATKVYDKPISIADPASKHTLPLGMNYLKNATFNSDIEQWRGSQNNNRWVSGAIESSIRSEHHALGRGAFSQCVNIGTNQFFELGGRVKVAVNNRKVSTRLRLHWYSDENCTGPSRAGYKNVDSSSDELGWKDKSTRIEAPVAVRSARINTTIAISGQGLGIVYWDDLYFKAIKPETLPVE